MNSKKSNNRHPLRAGHISIGIAAGLLLAMILAPQDGARVTKDTIAERSGIIRVGVDRALAVADSQTP
jgi:hypothetical protein